MRTPSYSRAVYDLHLSTRQHNNTNPITKEPLKPSDLITLHYSRKEATGEIHDPISFKPFSEHSHIVAIATTGNVFLAESIKGGKDLVNDVSFKKYVRLHFVLCSFTSSFRRADVITLQNPHGLPPASVANASTVTKTTKSEPTKPETSRAVAALKIKEAVPCMLFLFCICFIILTRILQGIYHRILVEWLALL